MSRKAAPAPAAPPAAHLPCCQSCGMPLEKPQDFGTNADASPNGEFCHYCFDQGSFTAPDVTMEGMLECCVQVMSTQGIMPAPEARKLMGGVLPKLARWARD